MTNKKKTASICIILSGILWGSMGLFVRTLNGRGLTSMEIVSLRAMVTAIVLFLYLVLFHQEMLHIHIRDLWCFLGTGIASIVFFNYCYFTAITITSLSVAAILLYTAPVIVMLLSRFLFKEAFTPQKILSLLFVFAGCVLVTGVLEDSLTRVSPRGILLGLGAGLGYALYSIFSRYALEREYHSLTITFYTFVFAAAAGLIFSNPLQVLRAGFSDPGMGLFSIAFGTLCTVLPYLLYTFGLNYIDNSRASIMASVEPVTATLIGAFVFHESLSLLNILGIILVILGLITGNSLTNNTG